jgi:hypothetical protein
MVILHAQQDNKLAVTVPCISLELAIAALSTNIFKVVETIDINNDFFDAYEFDQDKGAVLNIERAKEIKRNQFRQARKPLLEQLDVEYMRAVEASNDDKKKIIVAKKQDLRDVTSIELPDDVDELAKFWPDVLKSA